MNVAAVFSNRFLRAACVEILVIIIGAKARNVRVVPSRRRELEVVARYCAPVIDDKKESSPRSHLLRTRPICINETGKSASRKNISAKGSRKLNCISRRDQRYT